MNVEIGKRVTEGRPWQDLSPWPSDGEFCTVGWVCIEIVTWRATQPRAGASFPPEMGAIHYFKALLCQPILVTLQTEYMDMFKYHLIGCLEHE